MQANREIYDSTLTVAADSFLATPAFHEFEKYRHLRQEAADGLSILPDSLVASNPNFYAAYMAAGDYLFKLRKYKEAIPYYEKALTKEIATLQEEKHIRQQLKISREKSGG